MEQTAGIPARNRAGKLCPDQKSLPNIRQQYTSVRNRAAEQVHPWAARRARSRAAPSPAVQLSSHGDAQRQNHPAQPVGFVPVPRSVSRAEAFTRGHINLKRSAVQKYHFSSQTNLVFAQTPGAHQQPFSVLLYQKATKKKTGYWQNSVQALHPGNSTAHADLLKDPARNVLSSSPVTLLPHAPLFNGYLPFSLGNGRPGCVPPSSKADKAAGPRSPAPSLQLTPFPSTQPAHLVRRELQQPRDVVLQLRQRAAQHRGCPGHLWVIMVL